MAIYEDLVLKSSDTPLTDLEVNFDDFTGSSSLKFRTKKLLELNNTEVASSTLLNGRKVEHTKFTSINTSIVIGTDSLRTDTFIIDNAKMNALKAWWSSKHKYIALVPPNPLPSHTGDFNRFLASDMNIDFDEVTYTVNYYEVVTGGGVFPLSFINDLDLLPEFTLNLQKVLPI